MLIIVLSPPRFRYRPLDSFGILSSRHHHLENSGHSSPNLLQKKFHAHPSWELLDNSIIVMESTLHASTVPARDSGPVPMSFPAILRNPGLSDRFAHLRIPTEKTGLSASVARRNKRDDKEGKRWVRRKENAKFVGNAHIVAPSRKDYAVPMPSSRATFPQPLPNYLSRNNVVPPVPQTATEPSSANAGRFSLSLKGMRRELRKSGPRTELLVKEVEDELVAWLTQGGVLLSPDDAGTFAVPGVPIGTSDTIMEIARTPLQLVWSISEDAFTRYVVHCCARYHDVVSFSKDTSGQRLTYLLRPNVTRPSRIAAPPLDTPPLTDLSELSDLSGVESELPSDRDLSDADGPHRDPRALAAITELSDASAPPSPVVYGHPGGRVPSVATLDDGWSVIGGSDVEGDLSAPELEDITHGVDALALGEAEDRAVRRRQGPEALRSRLLDRQRRAASSPSRSPARRAPRRARQRAEIVRAVEGMGGERRSFYEYLFA
ncbi:hypothetical protein BC628DRAFT_1399632 [Trametes gibbosa]|nr:hypothetical protein BC628DRAFT_1399632 [Trametes gibbosa]